MRTNRELVSTRQRLVVLTFATAADAERWDADPVWASALLNGVLVTVGPRPVAEVN